MATPFLSRRLALFLFLLAFSLISSWFLLSLGDSESFHTSNLHPFLFAKPFRPPETLAAIENYQQGRWEPKEKDITTLDELHVPFPGVPWDERSCEGGLDRLFKIASWQWVAADGSVVGWDGRRFIVDSLRREGGIAFVGDSITKMFFEGVFALLLGLQFEYRNQFETAIPLVEHIVHSKHPDVHEASIIYLTLNPSHPATEDLLQEAGVSRQRLYAPIATMIRADFLATDPAVMNAACEEVGAKFNWDQKALFMEPWISHVKNYTTHPSPYKTLVVLNTGPHWGGAPLLGAYGNNDETVLAVIRSIVRRTFRALSTMNVKVIVRTGYPGERDCKNHTRPFEDVSSSNPHLFGWWERIAPINDILRDELGLLAPPQPRTSPRPSRLISSNATEEEDVTEAEEEEEEEIVVAEGMGPGPALLMDVERQGTLRSDARLRPNNGDCLYMCPAAIAEDWAKWLGMVMRAEPGAGWGA